MQVPIRVGAGTVSPKGSRRIERLGGSITARICAGESSHIDYIPDGNTYPGRPAFGVHILTIESSHDMDLFFENASPRIDCTAVPGSSKNARAVRRVQRAVPSALHFVHAPRVQ